MFQKSQGTESKVIVRVCFQLQGGNLQEHYRIPLAFSTLPQRAMEAGETEGGGGRRESVCDLTLMFNCIKSLLNL